jgi:hypothetical protein
MKRVTIALAAALLAGAPALLVPAPVWAQAASMGGVGQSDTITVRARVKAVDLKGRHVTLVGPSGESFRVAVGPEVQNLAQVKPGNMVGKRYRASVVHVLSAPGAQLPPDTLSVAGARAAPGQDPAGAVGAKLVVTGLVVAVDPVHHTISLVDPKGGAIRTLDVTDPERQRQLGAI